MIDVEKHLGRALSQCIYHRGISFNSATEDKDSGISIVALQSLMMS